MTLARPKSPRDSAADASSRTPAPADSAPAKESTSHARQIKDSDIEDLPVPIGEVIDSKYRVERLVGVGGMGIVMAAHDVMLDRPVAVKFLHGLNSTTAEANSRFKREARAMAKLHSEHVVHVLDVGTLPSGEPYMVMEYLEGIDLAQLVKQRGFLPPADAVDYLLFACEAVAEAHVMGIVHRDLKPSNLYLANRRDGTSTLKLLDFGIAKIASDDASEYAQSFTTTTALLGSPVYMSPEQLQCSRDADVRADIWSLGAIVYRLVAGRPPFAATTMPQLCTLIMTTAPQPLTQLVADVPPGLNAVVLKCLEKNADDRYENVAELARALAPFGSGRAQVSVERALAILYSQGGAPTPDRSSSVAFQLARPPFPSTGSGPSVSARSLVGSVSGRSSVHELGDSLSQSRSGSRSLLAVSLLVSLVLGLGLGLALWLRSHAAPPPDDSFAATAGGTSQTASTNQATGTPSPPKATATPPTTSSGPSIPVSALPAAADTPPPARPPTRRWTPPPRQRNNDVAASSPPTQYTPPYNPPPYTPPPPPSPADNSEFGGRK